MKRRNLTAYAMRAGGRRFEVVAETFIEAVGTARSYVPGAQPAGLSHSLPGVHEHPLRPAPAEIIGVRFYTGEEKQQLAAYWQYLAEFAATGGRSAL